MIRHLVTSGYALTECALTSAAVGSLATRLEDMNCRDCRASLIRKGTCPECGAKKLTWGFRPRNKPGVAARRLHTSDVETIFHLGCSHCYGTLLDHVDPATVAAGLTKLGWRPE